MRKHLSDKKVEINILPLVPGGYKNLATIGEAMTTDRSKQQFDQNSSGSIGNRNVNQYGYGAQPMMAGNRPNSTHFTFFLTFF